MKDCSSMLSALHSWCGKKGNGWGSVFEGRVMHARDGVHLAVELGGAAEGGGDGGAVDANGH